VRGNFKNKKLSTIFVSPAEVWILGFFEAGLCGVSVDLANSHASQLPIPFLDGCDFRRLTCRGGLAFGLTCHGGRSLYGRLRCPLLAGTFGILSWFTEGGLPLLTPFAVWT
jgi:hypothetical protein